MYMKNLKRNKIKKVLVIALYFISFLGKAQEEVPELITDRPDQTESAALVPVSSLQIETGFVMENDETDDAKYKSWVYNTTLLRYGLLENFELRLALEYLEDREEIKNTDTVNTISGWSPLYTGFKIKIHEEDGWKPDVVFIGGLVLPFTAHKDYKPLNTAACMRLAFAHTLSERFSLGYNLGVEWDGESSVPAYFYSLALGIGILDNLGMFIESFGSLPEEGDAEHLLDGGFTYLLLPNLQLDISGGIGINDASTDNFVGFGLSYRTPE